MEKHNMKFNLLQKALMLILSALVLFGASVLDMSAQSLQVSGKVSGLGGAAR